MPLGARYATRGPLCQQTDEIEPVNGFDCLCVSHMTHISDH